MGRIRIVEGDLTLQDVDAIVNAANEILLGGGGVDGAIHRAAGPDLLDACRALAETSPGVRCPTGEARLTRGFGLKARFVIHTVGPVWQGGGQGEPGLLASAYRQSLELAAQHGLRSVAFPAISCGAYGYPLHLASAIAIGEIRAFLAKHELPEMVLLVAFRADTAQALRDSLAQDGPSS